MTIREIATRNGITVQAVYKALKKAGINLATLKDGTGNITEEGMQKILEVITPAEVPPPGNSEELNRLKTEVEKLNTENNRLKTQVEMLISERDNLRTALEREQALTGLALQKIALPAPEDSTRAKGGFNRLKLWFKKGGDDHGN